MGTVLPFNISATCLASSVFCGMEETGRSWIGDALLVLAAAAAAAAAVLAACSGETTVGKAVVPGPFHLVRCFLASLSAAAAVAAASIAMRLVLVIAGGPLT